MTTPCPSDEDKDEDVIRFKLALELPPKYIQKFMEDRDNPGEPLTAREVGDFCRSECDYDAEGLFKKIIDAGAEHWSDIGECPFTGYIMIEIDEYVDSIRIG